MSNVKRLLFLSLLAGTALVLLFFLRRQDVRSGIEPETEAQSEAESAAPVSRTDAPAMPGAPWTESDQVPRELAPIPSQESSAVASGRVHVFGRVKEESGLPLAGVSVRFDSFWKPWNETVSTTKDNRDFQVETNAQGDFEFDLPVPTANAYMLYITPDPFHTQEQLRFSDGSAAGLQALLAEGERDLGSFQLSAAGTISGSIVDRTGVAVEDADLRLSGKRMKTGFEKRADGTYSLKHVPVETHELEASAGSAMDKKTEKVTIRAGTELRGIDFVLTRRGSIAGRIVDSDGAPIEGVRVTPSAGAGTSFGAQPSDRDGKFRAYLAKPEPHSLSATKTGFEPHEGTENHASGTEDAVIVMKRIDTMRFRVVDAVTGESIMRFGLNILTARNQSGRPINSSAHSRRAKIEEHEGGFIDAPADPRLHDYSIVAPGYAPARAAVLIDDPLASPKVVTINLRRGGSLIGRLVLDGEQIHSPQIRTERSPVHSRPGLDPRFRVHREEDFDLDSFAGAGQEHSGNEDGSFLIEHLAPGTYEVSIRGEGATTVVLEARVVEGETTELGEISSDRPGRIEGTIFIAGSLPETGLTVRLGTERYANSPAVQVDLSDASFEFGELDTGTQYLWFPAVEGSLVPGSAFPVEVKAGETARPQIDLSDRVPARVKVSVRDRKTQAPAVGYLVRLGPHPGGRFRALFEPTDRAGETRADVPARSETVLQVHTSQGFLVGETEPLDLNPGQVETVLLEINPGRLRVRAPMPPANEGFGDLYWSEKGATSSLGGELDLSWVDRGDGLREMEIGFAAPGTYVLSLYPADSLQSKKVEVEVVAGEEALAVFE